MGNPKPEKPTVKTPAKVRDFLVAKGVKIADTRDINKVIKQVDVISKLKEIHEINDDLYRGGSIG